jgi:hypothetical protein
MAEGQPIAVILKWVGGDPNPWDTVVYDGCKSRPLEKMT